MRHPPEGWGAVLSSNLPQKRGVAGGGVVYTQSAENEVMYHPNYPTQDQSIILIK